MGVDSALCPRSHSWHLPQTARKLTRSSSEGFPEESDVWAGLMTAQPLECLEQMEMKNGSGGLSRKRDPTPLSSQQYGSAS